MNEYVRLLLEDDAEALEWLDRMNDGPQDSGEFLAEIGDCRGGPSPGETPQISLMIDYFPAPVGSGATDEPRPSASPAASASQAAIPGAGASPEPGGEAAPAAGAAGGAGGTAFAESVALPGEVSTDPVILLQSAALAALLVFLMPFPSQLFNSTLETHEDEVRSWFRLDRLGSAAGAVGAFWSSWPGVIVFTLLAALLYGFLDPTFGLSFASLATFVGMLLGIMLVTAAFAVPAVLAHRSLGDRPSLKVVPVSLLIGVACVLLSRLTGFQPGYLYGVLIGLAFARELSAADDGRTIAIGAAVMLTVAFAAWLGLGIVPDGEGFGLVVLRTSLAALMVAGLEGVAFGLLPMRFLRVSRSTPGTGCCGAGFCSSARSRSSTSSSTRPRATCRIRAARRCSPCWRCSSASRSRRSPSGHGSASGVRPPPRQRPALELPSVADRPAAGNQSGATI